MDPIRHRHPFKYKLHLDYPGTVNQGTAYNSCMPVIGKLHVSIVDNQIRPNLLHSASGIPIYKIEIGKVWCQRKA